MSKSWDKYGTYIIFVGIALAVGALSGRLSAGQTDAYQMLAKPPFSPPAWLFPIVWSVLYVLMGISAAIIYSSDNGGRINSLIFYAAQLAVNFLWPIIYFVLKMRLFALVWLVLLLFLVLYMISKFNDISKTAAYLNLPYVFWLIFAFYLNLGTYLLNK